MRVVWRPGWPVEPHTPMRKTAPSNKSGLDITRSRSGQRRSGGLALSSHPLRLAARGDCIFALGLPDWRYVCSRVMWSLLESNPDRRAHGWQGGEGKSERGRRVDVSCVGTGPEFQWLLEKHLSVRGDQRDLPRSGDRAVRVMPRRQPARDNQFLPLSDDRGLDASYLVGIRVQPVHALNDEVTRTGLSPATAQEEDKTSGQSIASHPRTVAHLRTADKLHPPHTAIRREGVAGRLPPPAASPRSRRRPPPTWTSSRRG